MTKNHPRVAQGAASDSETARYQQLLDAEILPRLERPGRYLGPFESRGIATECAEITRLALLWPSVPESHHTPAGLAPLKRALESRSQLPLELVCVPAPDAAQRLVEGGVPLFSRPSWLPAGSFAELLLWIAHPAQLLGLLTLLELGGLPLRAADRGAGWPRVSAAGPLARRLPELLAVWCDQVYELDDPGELAERILERAEPETPTPNLPAGRPAISRDPDAPSPVGDLPTAEPRIRPSLGVPSELEGFTRDETFGGARVTRIRLLAASEPLRRRIGGLDSAELRELVVEALAHESGQLEIELELGLEGEGPEDRAAIPRLITQLCRTAPRGARQLKILLTVRLPEAHMVGFDAASLVACLDGIRERLPERKLRVQISSAREYAISCELLRRGAAAAPALERAHLRGAWHGDVDAAFQAERWPGFLEAAAAENGVAALLAPAERAAPTGLESVEALPPTLDENGHPLRPDEMEPVGKADRWRRWAGLVPREYQLRIVFEKRGPIRHLSHRETADLLLESCRRAGLPVAVAGVVSPRPKLGFGPSLPVGIESREEFADLHLTRKVVGVVAAMNEHLPEGLLVRRARYLAPGARCAHAPVQRAHYSVSIPEERRSELDKGLGELRARGEWWIERERAGECQRIDLANQVTRVHLDDDSRNGSRLHFECDLSVEGVKLKPQEVVAALLDSTVDEVCTLTLRREQLLSRGGEPMGAWRTPLELVEMANRRTRLMVKRYA